MRETDDRSKRCQESRARDDRDFKRKLSQCIGGLAHILHAPSLYCFLPDKPLPVEISASGLPWVTTHT